MTEVKWSQRSGPGPRGLLRRGALKGCHFAVVGYPETVRSDPLIHDEISAPEYFIVIIFIVLGAELLVA